MTLRRNSDPKELINQLWLHQFFIIFLITIFQVRKDTIIPIILMCVYPNTTNILLYITTQAQYETQNTIWINTIWIYTWHKTTKIRARSDFKWWVQASKHTHTQCNEVMLVLGSLRLTPIIVSSKYSLEWLRPRKHSNVNSIPRYFSTSNTDALEEGLHTVSESRHSVWNSFMRSRIWFEPSTTNAYPSIS